MMDIVKRIESKEIAIDHGFYVANGNWELCHHTGYMVKFAGDPVWWNEYQDADGNLYYGN